MRRAALLAWMNERSAHRNLTAAEIADVSGIYEGHGRADRCFDDLKALARKGAVTRWSGRPARWSGY
jgi:hypothetical protein